MYPLCHPPQNIAYVPWYLVPGTWFTSTRYCCLRVQYFKAPPFAAIYSYGSFLSAGLELSPIYSSIIYVRKILPLLCTWYSSKYFGCLVRCIAKLVLDDNGQVFFHENQENNSLRNRQSIAYNPFKIAPLFWGKSALIPCNLSPKRDCSSKRFTFMLRKLRFI